MKELDEANHHIEDLQDINKDISDMLERSHERNNGLEHSCARFQQKLIKHRENVRKYYGNFLNAENFIKAIEGEN